MFVLSRLSLAAFAVMLCACSSDDAPPAPTVAATPAATATAEVTPAPATETSAAAPATTPLPVPVPEPPPIATSESESVAAPVPAPALSSDAVTAYEVQCAAGATAAEQCQVDKATYIGWRTFSGQCQVCHGGSALGSSFAPNLLDRFHQNVDHARFVDVVTNGFRGQVGAMPGWKGNPNVMPHLDAMYRYLKARADGALPPGRPARKP
jgi:mono/diheme cytochrome c family protein